MCHPGQGRNSILIQIVPIVALLNSLLIAISILAAIIAIDQLRRAYRKESATRERIPLQTPPIVRILGLSAPVVLPMLFFTVWLFLLIN